MNRLILEKGEDLVLALLPLENRLIVVEVEEIQI